MLTLRYLNVPSLSFLLLYLPPAHSFPVLQGRDEQKLITTGAGNALQPYILIHDRVMNLTEYILDPALRNTSKRLISSVGYSLQRTILLSHRQGPQERHIITSPQMPHYFFSTSGNACSVHTENTSADILDFLKLSPECHMSHFGRFTEEDLIALRLSTFLIKSSWTIAFPLISREQD